MTNECRVRVSRVARDASFVCVALLLVATRVAAEETLVHDVAEFDVAVNAAKPGDAIVLANGEWRDADLVFRGVGEPYKRICIYAETPGKVVLTGKSRLRIAGKYLNVYDLLWKMPEAEKDVIAFRYDSKTFAENCCLVYCAIIDDAPTTTSDRMWVSLFGKNNVVTDCRFEGKRSRGALLVVWLDAVPNGHHIQYNFFGPRPRLGKNGGEIIRVGDSETSMRNSDTHVHDNYFYRCDGEAEIISNKSCGNHYSSNTFVGCSGALTLRHGNACIVNGNFFFGDGRAGTGGVRIIGEDHTVGDNVFYQLMGDDTRAALSLMNGLVDSPRNGYFQVRRADIGNNQFIDCKQSIVLGLSDDDRRDQALPPSDCRFVDNSVVTTDRPVFFVCSRPTDVEHASNTYAGGELGIEPNDGWRKGDVVKMRQEAMQFPVFIVKPENVGPLWLRPGDEYLPEALKSSKE